MDSGGQSIDTEIEQLATRKEFFQYSMSNVTDLMRNTRLAIEFKIRLENQYQVYSKKMQIDTPQEFEAQKNMAVLLRRLVINVDNKLIPSLTQHMDRN